MWAWGRIQTEPRENRFHALRDVQTEIVATLLEGEVLAQRKEMNCRATAASQGQQSGAHLVSGAGCCGRFLGHLLLRQQGVYRQVGSEKRGSPLDINHL